MDSSAANERVRKVSESAGRALDRIDAGEYGSAAPVFRFRRCACHGRRFCVWAFVQAIGFWPEHLFWAHIIGIRL